MIPELPPKKFAGNSQFQKDRLMGLSRYINLLAIHPTLKEDSLVNAFLTEPMVTRLFYFCLIILICKIIIGNGSV
jgi:hypothetical protein